MADPIETNAWISVARGCGFAGLATTCAMVGFSYNPVLALKFGGYCALLTAVILLLKAWRATYVRYTATETWTMLEKHECPPAHAVSLRPVERGHQCGNAGFRLSSSGVAGDSGLVTRL